MGRNIGKRRYVHHVDCCMPPPFVFTCNVKSCIMFWLYFIHIQFAMQELRRQIIDIDNELAALDEANDE